MSLTSSTDILYSENSRTKDNLLVSDGEKFYDYYAYGLSIRSEIPIPEFLATKSTLDVTIKVDRQHTLKDFLPPEVIEQDSAFSIEREEAIFYIQEIGMFLIQGGKTITLIPNPSASVQLIRCALVGTVMAILLYQRGLLVLHASAVNLNGEAVAFLGQSGEGKSSMAAAFQAQRYNVITDDVAPISLDSNPVTIAPGFPQMKLSSEVAETLGYDYDSLELLHPELDKRGYLFRDNFSLAALPLKRIYVLTTGDEMSIEPLKPSQALMELIRHSRPTTLFHAGDKAHFNLCVSLASKCCVYRLQRPRNLALLSKLVNYFSINTL